MILLRNSRDLVGTVKISSLTKLNASTRYMHYKIPKDVEEEQETALRELYDTEKPRQLLSAYIGDCNQETISRARQIAGKFNNFAEHPQDDEDWSILQINTDTPVDHKTIGISLFERSEAKIDAELHDLKERNHFLLKQTTQRRKY